MTDISAITTNLIQTSNGVWVARHNREVSYPAEGNNSCFAVEDTSFWFRHRNAVISHLVRHYTPSATFFDIGGGNGCVSNALQSSGIDAVLVEPGPAGALNAKKRGVRTVVQSTLEDAGFAPNSIPSAGLFDVIEHIENDLDFLRMVHNSVRPHGTVYITVPAYKFLWSHDDERAGHFRRYTVQSLSSVLSEAGFEVRYATYLFAFLVPPIFLFRTIPSWVGARKSISSATRQNEHSTGKGIMHAALQKWLGAELRCVMKRKKIAIGSSCIAVATKKACGCSSAYPA